MEGGGGRKGRKEGWSGESALGEGGTSCGLRACCFESHDADSSTCGSQAVLNELFRDSESYQQVAASGEMGDTLTVNLLVRITNPPQASSSPMLLARSSLAHSSISHALSCALAARISSDLPA